MSNRKFNRKRPVRTLPELRRAAFFVAVVLLALGLMACAPRASSVTSEAQTNSTTTTTSTTHSTHSNANAGSTNAAPPVVSAHGGAAMPPVNSSGDGGMSSSASNGKPDVDTAALDAKIEQAERKAKSSGATDADKHAAAAAYLERGKIFMSNGQREPRVYYRLALGDFRRSARYDPDNKEARDNIDLLVTIYQSMNRPVPDIGNEP